MAVHRRVLPIAIALFVLLLVGTILSVRVAVDEPAEQALVVDSFKVIVTAERILSGARAAEASERGYVLTHNPAYLAAYPGLRASVERDVEAFRAMTTRNRAQQDRARQIRVRVAALFAAFDHSAAAVRTGAGPAQAAIVAHERAEMTELGRLVTGAIAEEQKLLGPRVARNRNSEANEIRNTAAGAALAFVLMAAGLIFLMRSNANLSRSEAVRAAQATMLQAILDNIRDGIAMFDGSGRLRAFNRNFFRFLDFPDALAREGTKVPDFVAAEKGRAQSVVPSSAAAAPETGYRRIRLKEKEFDVYRADVPGDAFLVAVMDVTVRVQAETALRLSQKMEAVGQLTGGVAHDFNNLLQIISANLDLVAAELRGNGRSAERLQNAIGAVERGSRLTAQLLAFARKQALEPRSVDLGRLVQDITELLRRTLGEHIEIATVLTGDLWNTLVDPAQVENTVLNLAINARDAMPDGGKLTIEVANAYLDDAYVLENGDVAPGEYVMLAVTDTGCGMPPDTVVRAFDPFFTTKPEGKGTGLGLSQVYGFVKQSGGHVRIYSEVDCGTTVKLYLPRTRKATEQSNVSAVAQPIEGGQDAILVVEDDPGVRAAVVDMLTELGYSVLWAENAEQALVVLASGVPIDLLFTDVVMPGPISTRELARRAQTLHPRLVVLFTSGYTQNAIVHNGKLDENVMLISKPYRKDELARKIRMVLSRRRPSEAAPPSNVEPPLSAPRRNGDGRARLKILVVEDVALIRMTTIDMIEELGFVAVEAGDGIEALSILEKDPEIAVLMTDLGLPGLNGQELAIRARAMRPEIRIVIASGNSLSADDKLSGALLLMKPFDIKRLREALAS